LPGPKVPHVLNANWCGRRKKEKNSCKYTP